MIYTHASEQDISAHMIYTHASEQDIHNRKCQCSFKIPEKCNSVIEKFLVLYNNKYNQKPPHIYVMTKWMTNNYFFVIKLYIRLSPLVILVVIKLYARIDIF